MEKKSTKIAYGVACAVVVVLLVILGIVFKDRPILVEEATTPFAGTIWSLLGPVVAIVLALISKEVYSSLFIGCLVGTLLYTQFRPWDTVVSLMTGDLGIVASADFSIVLFLVLLGVLIFVDDYFNCLTVGAVMRPVTESHKISRAKLAYVIDATAAPVCMIAPVSSWAAAVAGYVQSDSVNGIELFIRQIPYNYYCLLTLVMIVVISLLNIDYGPMLTHEYNAQVKDDLFTTEHRPFAGDDEYEEGAKKGSVLDLILPVIVLIAACVIGLIYTGGFFDGVSFIDAFADCSAGPGLCIGSLIGVLFTFVWFWLRGAISFTKSMESIPGGFTQMIAPILILCLAWTLCNVTRNGLYSMDFVVNAMENAGSLLNILPAIIFIIGAFIGFATGTSWGTIGIMAPIVVNVFNYDDPMQQTLCVIGLAAACAGGVCGDHCSPISDTTIMASAGAHCYHLNHVYTQLPYAITVACVSFVSFLIAGFVQNVIVCLIIAVALMVGTLLVIKTIVAKKHAGIFQEMAEANKVLANQ